MPIYTPFGRSPPGPTRVAQPVQGGGQPGVRQAPGYQGGAPYGGTVYVHPPNNAPPPPDPPQPPQPRGYLPPPPPGYGGGSYGYSDPYAGSYPYDPYGYGSYPQMSSPYGYPSGYGYGYDYSSSYGGAVLGMLGGMLANGPHDELSPEEEYAVRQFYQVMRQRR